MMLPDESGAPGSVIPSSFPVTICRDNVRTELRRVSSIANDAAAAGRPMTMNEEERISERLKTARRLAGLTQEDAARALDVTLKTYARWERGETKGFLRQLSRIAEVFGVTSDQLLGTDDDAGPDRLERLEASVEEIRAEVAAIRSLLEERLPLVR